MNRVLPARGLEGQGRPHRGRAAEATGKPKSGRVLQQYRWQGPMDFSSNDSEEVYQVKQESQGQFSGEEAKSKRGKEGRDREPNTEKRKNKGEGTRKQEAKQLKSDLKDLQRDRLAEKNNSSLGRSGHKQLRSLSNGEVRRNPIYNEDLLYQENEQQARRFWEEFNRTYFEYLPTNKFDDLRRSLLKYELQPSDIEAIYRDLNYLSTFREQVVLDCLPELKTDRSIRALYANPALGAAYLIFYGCQPSRGTVDYTAPPEGSYQIQVFGNKGTRPTNIIKQEDRVGAGFGLDSTIVIDVSDYYDKLVRYTRAVAGGPVGSIEAACADQEVDREIELWKGELRDIQDANSRALNRLQLQMEASKPLSINQRELDLIDEKLLWSNILKHFREGHADKTDQIFQSYKISEDLPTRIQRPHANKGKNKPVQKFQTDCKICFCSSNYESNKVLYCDNCNTSYHQYCYGLSSIPKSEIYYCDSCSEQKRTDCKERPRCKICQKINFPMKKLDGHFYHVTCLVLNNFVEIRDRQLCLKKGIDFKSITRKVVESEARQTFCEYCVHQINYKSGIQLPCSYPGCRRTFHPICAYLYGCQFDLRVVQDGPRLALNVKAYCKQQMSPLSNHDKMRDTVEQIYFRRYVCNLNKTSEMKRDDFLADFHKEELKREKYKLQEEEKQDINLFKVTSTMKDYWKSLKEESIRKYKTETSKLIQRIERNRD